ncbi:GNAT family N-acetyltransferase [Luteimonas suaedae]|uniref:GNAT family N-acetyltransferase n=1 Tax=Luteimonas suaedae TaxID=2605430 RepID=UPI0011EE6B8A|nr:GNAT family N-acetyltransferase [Luteimonas suaedae]
MTTNISGVRYVSPYAVPQAHLLKVARQIFSDTFSQLYEEDAFRDFCDRTWAEDGPMAKDLADASVSWRIATVDDVPIGYAKLTPLRAPAQDARAGALELQQIYVLSQWQGKGVAEALMGWAMASARAQDAPELYLTVFDHNERAKRFYARHGFEEVGRCTFKLGDRLDDDRIWRKVL